MDKFFKISERGSTVRTEILGGLTTFFAMAYIILVNPGILCVDLGDGFFPAIPGEYFIGVAVATCLAAALGTLLTAFLANVPFAQAPGMGLNAFFTYTVCLTFGFTWRQALSIVLISGVIFFIVAISPVRSKIISSIPASLKSAIGAGIGLFIAFIGFLNAGIVNFGAGVPALSSLKGGTALLAVIGLILIAIFMVLKVKGAIILGMIATAIVGIIPSLFGSDFFGVFSTADVAYNLNAIGDLKNVAFQFDFAGLFENGLAKSILPVITAVISFALVDCFDTVGTLIGTATNAGMLDKKGNFPGGDKALIADAIATCSGSCLGTSTVTTFVESSAGISSGARTGLSSLVVAVLFLFSVLLTPFFKIFSNNTWFLYGITAPALIIVGVLMIKSAAKIDWSDIEEAIPCFLTIAGMPFFYSISDGIGFGFISYVILKLVRGKAKQVPVLMYIIAALFVAMYVLKNI